MQYGYSKINQPFCNGTITYIKKNNVATRKNINKMMFINTKVEQKFNNYTTYE